MCGIFGYIGSKKNAYSIVLRGLKDLEYRGYDSWGIAFSDAKNNKKIINLTKKTGKINDAEFESGKRVVSKFVLGHTRWATHGGVTVVNAHPHLDCSSKFAVIHNGIIENYSEIKKNLLKKGHIFKSDTDSEVAIHLIEDNFKEFKSGSDTERILKSVQKAFSCFMGLNAIIVMDLETEVFVAAKNGSPLVIGKGKNENFLASDAHALIPYTREVYFMNDNDLVLVSNNKISLYNSLEDKEYKPIFQKLDWKINKSQKGKYPHFMIKEIHDQVQLIADIADKDDKNIDVLARLINKSYGTYLIGCGTAAYACLAGTYLFSKIAKIHVNFAPGSEFENLLDFLTPKSLIIALSQSGETIDVLEPLKKAKEKKVTVATLVNVIGSTLYRLADLQILLGAGIEQAVVSTKAFVAKISYLMLLAFTINNEKSKGIELLRKAKKSVTGILKILNLRTIRELAKYLSSKEHIYVIGRGLSYPVALETALKIKEASYIHAEGFAAGELKHGVIALIEKDTPCIAFLPNDEMYGANLAGAMEMKARGGKIIGISYKPHEIFDYYLHFDDCGIASIIPASVIGQLLGYYLAVYRGHDPDKPRNLAKSVTVK
jgi:glutamine---fructose-6-phosphate transaminase (isomerizing)